MKRKVRNVLTVYQYDHPPTVSAPRSIIVIYGSTNYCIALPCLLIKTFPHLVNMTFTRGSAMTIIGFNFNPRPISCYKGSATQKIAGDVPLEEELVVCNFFEDVCYGRVTLTVSNKTDTDTSEGYIQVGDF